MTSTIFFLLWINVKCLQHKNGRNTNIYIATYTAKEIKIFSFIEPFKLMFSFSRKFYIYYHKFDMVNMCVFFSLIEFVGGDIYNNKRVVC